MALMLCACGNTSSESTSADTIVVSASLPSSADSSSEALAEPPAEPTSEPTEEPTAEPTDVLTPEPTEEPTPEPTEAPAQESTEILSSYENGQPVYLDPNWEFASYSMINTGNAVMYTATENRKNIIIGVNAGHGTSGGSSVYTYCHPDYTPKVTGGSTGEGAVQATAVSTGMTFYDGTPEATVTLRMAQILRDLLLSQGYDVLMIRDGDDVQLDNIARTVICNNVADCHIALHWDGDGFSYDKGCYYMSVPSALEYMYPVSVTWPLSEQLGNCLVSGLSSNGIALFEGGAMDSDLTQTSYSTIASVDIELGNSASDHSDETLTALAWGLLAGINMYFGQ